MIVFVATITCVVLTLLAQWFDDHCMNIPTVVSLVGAILCMIVVVTKFALWISCQP